MALANEQYYRAGHINSIFSILDWPHTNYETEVRPWICIPEKIFVATPLIPWLVVFRQPLWKMMELLVTWGYDIPNWMEIHVPNNIYIYITYISLGNSHDPKTHWRPTGHLHRAPSVGGEFERMKWPRYLWKVQIFPWSFTEELHLGVQTLPPGQVKKKKHAISINWDIIDYKWDSMCI